MKLIICVLLYLRTHGFVEKYGNILLYSANLFIQIPPCVLTANDAHICKTGKVD